eukprot:TRINITY_DN4644_c0_g1_i6.p1 TRINITY_DN4644_c0_g1~~TRINITY_DN4644_c0_g1_i6.p1  ORF type:complete len:493 (+),score=171.65 TRINITY_DN4644_c0_g1_i6:52-1530(+)
MAMITPQRVAVLCVFSLVCALMMVIMPMSRAATGPTGSTVTAEDVAHFTGDIIIQGMARNMDELQPATIELLEKLNCEHNIAVEIMVRDFNPKHRVVEQEHISAQKRCAPWVVYKEPKETASAGNRVQRITYARDAQRGFVKRRYGDRAAVVMVADLDMNEFLVTAEVLAAKAKRVATDPSAPTVTCAMGQQRTRGWTEYYDTFATVLEDGTFIFPANARPPQNAILGNERFVIQNDVLDDFTGWEMGALARAGAKKNGGTFKVKSCFGGIALYKASAWFDTRCSYQDNGKDEYTLYREEKTNVACEHLALHLCMDKVQAGGAPMVIDPEIQTFWDDPHPPVFPVARFRGPRFGQYNEDTKVSDIRDGTGKYLLSFNADARLVLEDVASGRELWTPELHVQPQKNWYRVFLWMDDAGDMVIEQQVAAPDEGNRDKCQPRGHGDACKMLLWRAGARSSNRKSAKIRISGDGRVQLVHEKGWSGEKVYWSSPLP